MRLNTKERDALKAAQAKRRKETWRDVTYTDMPYKVRPMRVESKRMVRLALTQIAVFAVLGAVVVVSTFLIIVNN